MNYAIEYKKIADEEARLLQFLAECAQKRAGLIELELQDVE